MIENSYMEGLPDDQLLDFKISNPHQIFWPRVRTSLIRKEKKIGRNEPCPCGSKVKYKKCCLNNNA